MFFPQESAFIIIHAVVYLCNSFLAAVKIETADESHSRRIHENL